MANLPRTRSEAMHLLWALLKERRRIRGHLGGLGHPVNMQVQLTRSNGQIMRTRRVTDLTLEGDGWVLLGEAVGVWSDDLPRNDYTPVALIVNAVYELVRTGVLRPRPGTHGMFITEHGAAVLDADDRDLPPGDAKRVEVLHDEFAAIQNFDIIERHYREALAAYEVGLDYSATVMIGVCYEAGLVLLAKAIADWQSRTGNEPPGVNRQHRQNLPKVRLDDYVPASGLEGLVFDVLSAVGPDLGGDREWLRTCFRPTCHFVRLLRNQAGHPTGHAIPRDDVAAHIMLLPAFLRRVVSISNTLARLP